MRIRSPRIRRVISGLALVGLTVLGAGATAWASVAGSDVIPVGAAPDKGSLLDSGIRPVSRVLGITSTADGDGYWMVAGDGGVFAFGSAPFHGSLGATRLNQPIVGMAPTASVQGYWLFAGDGGIFSFGDAVFHGSLPGELAKVGLSRPNKPIVAMTPTASGDGYWMLGSDGGVFTFGDASFLGSLGSATLSSPIVGMATLRSGTGYWVVDAKGRVYAFGAAQHHGDLATTTLSNPVVGMAVTPSGNGYWLAQADGDVWAFGDANASLATAPRCLGQPVTGLAARPQGDGLWLVTAPRPEPATAGLFPLTALDNESADVTAELRSLQACQSPMSASAFRITDPLPGASIGSHYGNRIHPVYKVPQFHRGVDLAGGTTTIRAAAAGTVIEASTRVGYGNTLVIDHGGRIATLYGHISRFLVGPGQKVSAGQAIAIVGATGFATGPHLHFEIRVNGDVINPEPYL